MCITINRVMEKNSSLMVSALDSTDQVVWVRALAGGLYCVLGQDTTLMVPECLYPDAYMYMGKVQRN